MLGWEGCNNLEAGLGYTVRLGLKTKKQTITTTNNKIKKQVLSIAM